MEIHSTESRGVIGEPTVAPSRIWAIVSLLRSSKDGLAGEDVDRALMPTARLSEKGGRAMLRKNLLEAREAGLIIEDGDRLHIADDVHPSVLDSSVPSAVALTDAILGGSSSRNDALGYALSWLLDQDPYGPDDDRIGTAIVKRMAEDQVEGLTRVTSDATYGAFEAWATYLGFAHASPLGTGALVPDPTKHLRTRLSTLFASSAEVPFFDVINRLASLVPLFEGGQYRNAIVHDRPADHLSRSSSLVWLRLEDEGVVRLSQPSDADVLILDDVAGYRPVSHVALI